MANLNHSYFGNQKKALLIFRESVGLPSEEEQITEMAHYAYRANIHATETVDFNHYPHDLINELANGVSMVIVWRFDCLLEKIKDFESLCNFISSFLIRGIEFVSVRDNFSTTNQTSLVQLLDIWYAAKVNRRSELARINATTAKLNGSHYGRTKPRDDEQIQKLHSEGYSTRKIAAMIGLSATSVRRSLNNEQDDQETVTQP